MHFYVLVYVLKCMTEQKKITRMMLYKHCFRLQYKALGFSSLAALSDLLVFLSLTTAFLLLVPQVWYIKSDDAFLEERGD